MILYFLRHAHAEDGGGKPDELRALTDAGHEQARDMAALLGRLKLHVSVLYTSPRIRAAQTAAAVAAVLNVTPVVRDELSYGFGYDQLETLVRDASDAEGVMLVGHEPTLSQTIRDLTGGLVDMKKCGLARVDIHIRRPLRGELVWLLPPRLVRGLTEDR
jgi:phosphohistidine phosphatase